MFIIPQALKKRAFALVVLLAQLFCLTFFSPLTIAKDSGSISVVDDRGRMVILPKPARRIISLAPHTTEMLFAAGAGKQTIGAVSYSDYPEAAKLIPVIGSHQRVDLEFLLSLQPDLIVGWYSGNGADQLEKIERLNIPVYLTEPKSLEDIARSVRHLGSLTGNPAVADLQSEQFLTTLYRLKNTYSHLPKLSVFYQVWNQPLITINGQHLITRLIELCGGRNVFSDLNNLAPHIDLESVLLANPDVIVASGMDEERPEWLDAWRSWKTINAVRNDNLLFIPPDIIQRHSPRILQGAELMCEQLQAVRSKSLQ
jgi:iron complex transport system substrate-binding protein